jgi:XTP/dITP diphosphohydrolase
LLNSAKQTQDLAPASKSLTLFLASGNSGKLREFRLAAAERDVIVESIPSLSSLPPCVEDGETFAANARKKALHYSEFETGLVFADDSGICVDALDGAPGVYSARFSGPEATDDSNNARLLSELERTAIENRSAHYVCVIALAHRGRLVELFEGRADGLIIGAPRGTGGFGYDPYFYFPPIGKTFAELPPEEKFAVSHRGIAFRLLLEYLAMIKTELSGFH